MLLSGLSSINCMETSKYLDVKLDFKLNHKLQITLVENKVARSVGILSKLRFLFFSPTLLLLYYSSGHGMKWNGKWNGMERKFRYGIWKMLEWNGVEDFKNGMEDNLPYFHTNSILDFLNPYLTDVCYDNQIATKLHENE